MDDFSIAWSFRPSDGEILRWHDFEGRWKGCGGGSRTHYPLGMNQVSYPLLYSASFNV